MTSEADVRIAYFSMENAVASRFSTYSGGLGVLAGDTLRSAADLEIPIVGVTLLHRKGYFRQHLDGKGQQSEEPQEWNPEGVLEPVEPRVLICLDGQEVKVRAWRYSIIGLTGHNVPVYFLDVDFPGNSAWERTLTDHLYGGDPAYRLCQEAILGIAGVRFLRALGNRNISRFHMNEGHSALLTLALLEEEIGRQNLTKTSLADIERVREKCVFTTHTPVPAAFDQFPLDLATRILGADRVRTFLETQCCTDGTLNMTHLALLEFVVDCHGTGLWKLFRSNRSRKGKS
jgi:glycogen phosphorylase